VVAVDGAGDRAPADGQADGDHQRSGEQKPKPGQAVKPFASFL